MSCPRGHQILPGRAKCGAAWSVLAACRPAKVAIHCPKSWIWGKEAQDAFLATLLKDADKPLSLLPWLHLVSSSPLYSLPAFRYGCVSPPPKVTPGASVAPVQERNVVSPPSSSTPLQFSACIFSSVFPDGEGRDKGGLSACRLRGPDCPVWGDFATDSPGGTTGGQQSPSHGCSPSARSGAWQGLPRSPSPPVPITPGESLQAGGPLPACVPPLPPGGYPFRKKGLRACGYT